VTLVFGEEVSSEQRQLISDGLTTAVQADCSMSGVGADFTFFAFNDFETLVSTYADWYGIPTTRAREEWLKDINSAAGRKSIFLNIPRMNLDQLGMAELFAHEYFHIIQETLVGEYYTGRAFPDLGARWLTEGSAQYVAALAVESALGEDFEGPMAFNKQMAMTLTAPLASLEDMGAYGPGVPGYRLGFMAVDYLRPVDQPPRAILPLLIAYWSTIGTGKSWKQSFQSVFGKDISQFYSDFEAYQSRGFRR
jgi:hypothetical protein